MRRSALLLVSAATLASAAPAAAQSLAERVERAPASSDVTFQLPARPGVCGYGDAVIRFSDEHRDGYSIFWSRGDHDDLRGLGRETLRSRCEFGPVQVTLERDGRAITRVRARVAAGPRSGTTNLGAVSTAQAADYLIGRVARTAGHRVASDAMALFMVAEGESWQPLLTLARDRSASAETRKNAVFWLGQAAGERATAGLKGILADDSDELEVRKQAVFALSQQRTSEAVDVLMETAQKSHEPEIRRSALFWLGQRAGDDPRVLALFEKILVGR